MIRILLVDDQKVIREAVKRWLEPEADFEIIGTADNGLSAIDQVDKLKPDVVVMNMEMPGLDGIGATKYITSRFNNTKVLILSSFDTHDYIAKSLSVGAKGYLLKNTSSRDIATAIRSVNRGYTQISPGLLDKLLVQTDSGTIISQLQRPLDASQDTQFINKTRRTIFSLHSTVKKQGIELNQLKQALGQIKQDCLQTKKKVARYSIFSWLNLFLLLLSLPLLLWLLSNFNTRLKSLVLRTDELEENSFPIERVGIYQEYDLSGLAQRVAKTFQQDLIVTGIDTVNIAQKDHTIILSGTVPDALILERMEMLAGKVKGVKEVDISGVEIIQVEEIKPAREVEMSIQHLFEVEN